MSILMNLTQSMEFVPPSPLTSGISFYMTMPYSVFFILGTVGNVSVLTYVYYITRSLKWSVMALGNTLVYVMVLSFVDLLVTLSIPFHVTQQILSYWIFGNVICKLYWVLEIASKMCSTFILCALAFDRYMAICHPEIKRVHNVRQTAAISFFTGILSLVLIMPIVASAHVRTDKIGGFFVINHTIKEIQMSMCTDGMPTNHKVWLMALLAMVAFLMPTLAIIYFYAKITMRLRVQMTSHIQSRIPYRRITAYTLLITLFYLVCQCPFWLIQIYGAIAMAMDLSFTGSQSMIYVYYVLHSLPYISASFNWLIYALLNSQFKKGFVLVTERMLRKQTREASYRAMLPNGREACVWDGGVTVDVASRCDDVVALCPNCEHPLTLRMKANQYSTTTA